MRPNLKAFVETVLDFGLIIESISWWEYITNKDKNPQYGSGGPQSFYFDGQFAECNEIDDLPANLSIEKKTSDILKIIEQKQLKYIDGTKISFKCDKSLTPAFWLGVDDSWKNRFHN